MEELFFVPHVGQYGNKLYPTILACLIANVNNCKLNFPEIPLVKFKESFVQKHQCNTIISREDAHALRRPIKKSGKLILPRGYYQNSDIFNVNLKLIKSTILDLPLVTKNTKDVVMHLRLDGFNHDGHNSHILHPEFYKNILDSIQFQNLYIVMATKSGRIWKQQTQHKDKYLSYFDKYNYKVISNDEYTDFEFIRSFDQIICSNSTFAWWAAFLSDASSIWMPEHFEGKHSNLSKIKNSIICSQEYVNIETMEKVPLSFS
jgi:hypothetical protein